MQRIMARKLTSCLRCNGRGHYRGSTSGLVIVCPVCDGTGRDAMRGRA